MCEKGTFLSRCAVLKTGRVSEKDENVARCRGNIRECRQEEVCLSLSFPYPLLASFTFLNKSEAKIKSFRRWLVAVMISSLLPSHSLSPS